MIALYRPGESVLHRVNPAVKLLALALTAVLVTVMPQSPISLGLFALAVAGAYLVAGLGLRELVRQVVPLRWLVLVMLVTGLIFLTPWATALTITRVLLLVLLAALVTLTTRSEALVDTLEAALRPLSSVGVDVRRVTLTLSLTLSAIPVIVGHAQRLREAQLARGVRLGLRAILPLLVMSLRHADEVADAMIARGIDEQSGT